jgi:hypothetical protein
VIFSGEVLRILESGQFTGRASLGTGQSGTPQDGASLFCSLLLEFPKVIFLVCVCELYAPKKISTRQTS